MVTVFSADLWFTAVSQRSTIASQNEALQAASQRERVLQTKFSKLTEESERKEAERDAKILELETNLAALTVDWERQASIAQGADAKAEAELEALAESKLALADRGFVSSDSENGGDDPALDVQTQASPTTT